MKKLLTILAAMLLSVTISAQDMGGAPGGMPPGGMGPGQGMPPGGPRGERPGKKDKKPKEKELTEKQKAKAEAKRQKALAKEFILAPHVYIYAMGVKDGDSTVYVTDIQTLDSVKIVRANGFLVNRQDYSAQFKNYLVNSLQETNRTCAVSFNRKEKTLASDLDKLKKKYAKRHLLVKVVDPTQFQFIVTNE